MVEVVSPESEERDRGVKPTKYAAAGIDHYWRIEEDTDGATVVYLYELDPATRAYAPVAITREKLQVGRPFPLAIDVDALYR